MPSIKNPTMNFSERRNRALTLGRPATNRKPLAMARIKENVADLSFMSLTTKPARPRSCRGGCGRRFFEFAGTNPDSLTTSVMRVSPVAGSGNCADPPGRRSVMATPMLPIDGHCSAAAEEKSVRRVGHSAGRHRAGARGAEHEPIKIRQIAGETG